jgi:hypothetical protein
VRWPPARELVGWSELVGERSVGGLLRFSCCQKLVAEARRHFGSPENGERPPLEAVTGQRLVKTQQAEKT